MSIEDQYDALFKALGHRVRRRLLDLLRSGPQTTGHLCEAMHELDRCTVMQHLRVLERAGLIIVERRGRERWNHFDALPIHDLQTRWIGPYAEYAVSVLSDLKAGVENDDTELNEPPMQAQDQIKQTKTTVHAICET